ncbi:MAG: energy transducer TonB [Saprospiraceae bacterium]
MKSLLLIFLMALCFSCKKEKTDVAPCDVVEIFKVVEDMPAFPGCEGISSKAEKQACSDEKLTAFIEENLEYPVQASMAGLEGMVVISFIVETDGSILCAEITRDIGMGCGEEALRVIKQMPNWEPGKQRGTPVRVQVNWPVYFEL